VSGLLLALACGAALGPSVARAETAVSLSQRADQRSLLIMNAGDLLTGVISVDFERALTSWLGLTGGFDVWTFRGALAAASEPFFTALGPEIGVRFHLYGTAPGGLWLGPTVSGAVVLWRNDGVTPRWWSWGVGVAAGYNFVLGEHFTLQVGAGAGFMDYGDRVVWSPRLRLGIGGLL
jgi:hypothetical protein